MDNRKLATGAVVALGLATAAYGLFLTVDPMLLDAEHVAPLRGLEGDPGVRDLLLFASFQVAALSFAWGVLVAGLAPAAILHRDRAARLALWVGGAGGIVFTTIPMILIADWVGVAFGLIPLAILGTALLAPASSATRTVPVQEPAAEARERERDPLVPPT